MYLSRVKIDMSNRMKVKQLDNLSAYHSWVEDSFPDELKSGYRTRKLWRVDEINNDYYLLVLSPTKPDLIEFERYGVKNSAETKNYNILLNNLCENEKLRFRTTLNPIKSLSQGKKSGKRGRVIPLVTVQQQLDYLEQRALFNGFSVNSSDVVVTSKGFYMLKKRYRKPLRICIASYEGLLKIENLENFKKSLISGIGKKKAYGCGLLTVIPNKIL